VDNFAHLARGGLLVLTRPAGGARRNLGGPRRSVQHPAVAAGTAPDSGWVLAAPWARDGGAAAGCQGRAGQPAGAAPSGAGCATWRPARGTSGWNTVASKPMSTRISPRSNGTGAPEEPNIGPVRRSAAPYIWFVWVMHRLVHSV